MSEASGNYLRAVTSGGFRGFLGFHLLQGIIFNQDYTSLLNDLKDLTPEKLASGIEVLRLNSKVLGLEKSLGNTLYICSFYSTLFDYLTARLNGTPLSG